MINDELYPKGFFVTDAEEIVYSTGNAHEISLHVKVIRLLENDGPTEQYECFDRLRPALPEDIRKFKNAVYEYITNKTEYYQKQINTLRDTAIVWYNRADRFL